MRNLIIYLSVYYAVAREYIVQYKKQITDIIALLFAVFTVVDMYYGAPAGQMFVKVALAVLSWFSGRYADKIA